MSMKQLGFTLIELMIVIAIVAILVALAVPAYQDYTIRSKVAECVNQAAVPKLQVSEYRETVGDMPPDANEAGISGNVGDSQFCDGFPAYTRVGVNIAHFSVEVDEAAVDASISGEIEPRLVGFSNASGGVDWQCQRGATAAGNLKYLPSTCRATNTP